MSGIGESYTCGRCGGTFEKEVSDEDAIAEALSLWTPETMTGEQAIVCDPCFREFMQWVQVNAPEPLRRSGAQMPRLSRFLSEDCPECGTPGYHRHLSAVGGCETCVADDPRPVHIFPCSPRGVIAPGGKCYRLAGGAAVHVQPDCRC